MARYGNHDAFLFHAGTSKRSLITQLSGSHLNELTYGVLHAGCDNEVFWFFLLQHHPLHFYVVFGVAPVTQGIHVAEVQARFRPCAMFSDSAGDLRVTKVSPRRGVRG